MNIWGQSPIFIKVMLSHIQLWGHISLQNNGDKDNSIPNQ